MLILGGLGLLMSCQMDTSVPTSYGRVINLPLAAQQQNMSLIKCRAFYEGLFCLRRLSRCNLYPAVDRTKIQLYNMPALLRRWPPAFPHWVHPLTPAAQAAPRAAAQDPAQRAELPGEIAKAEGQH
jgi:hypothetical protein